MGSRPRSRNVNGGKQRKGWTVDQLFKIINKISMLILIISGTYV